MAFFYQYEYTNKTKNIHPCNAVSKIFASGVNYSIFPHFFVLLSLKLLKLGEIDGVKFWPENPAV